MSYEYLFMSYEYLFMTYGKIVEAMNNVSVYYLQCVHFLSPHTHPHTHTHTHYTLSG